MSAPGPIPAARPHTQTMPRPELRAEDVLSTEQLQRLRAVTEASRLVRAAGFLGASGAPDCTDLLRVATWVVKGTDPWDDITPGSVTPTATDGDQQDDDAAPSSASSS
jgi:hypothetical protein